MPKLNVDLMTPKGVVMEGIEIEDHLPSEELIAQLVNTLGLPRGTVEGEPITYTLEIMNQGRTLQPGQTPGEAGAGNGDVIRLVSSRPVGGEEPKSVADDKGEKEQVVVVSLPDLMELLQKNRGTTVEPVADVISSNSAAQQSFFSKHRTAVLAILLLVGSAFLFIIPNRASQKENANNALKQALDEAEATPTPAIVSTAVQTALATAPTAQSEMTTETGSPTPELHRAHLKPRTPRPFPAANEKDAVKKGCNPFKWIVGGCKKDKKAEKTAQDKKKIEETSKRAPGFIRSTATSSTQYAVQSTVNSSVHRLIR